MTWKDSIKKDRYWDSGYDDDRHEIAFRTEQRAEELDESLTDVIERIELLKKKVLNAGKVTRSDEHELRNFSKLLETLARGF
jgi:uncharacterized protein YktB (UPF0637 family)